MFRLVESFCKAFHSNMKVKATFEACLVVATLYMVVQSFRLVGMLIKEESCEGKEKS